YGGDGAGEAAGLADRAAHQHVAAVHQRVGYVARVLDGRNGRLRLLLMVVEEYPWTSGALEGAKLEAWMVFPGRIKEFLSNWRVSYPVNLDGHDVQVVQGTGAQSLIATLYFDKESGLLTRMIHYHDSAIGRVPTQIDLSDYRPVAGVMVPFKWSYGWPSGRQEYTWTEVQANAAVDAAQFARPVP